MLLVSRARAYRSRLPPGTSCERGGCARATVSRALLACARMLSRRAAKALARARVGSAWSMRSSPALSVALLVCIVLALALGCVAMSRTMHSLSAGSCRMSISSVGCTEVSEARSCELLSPIGARARALRRSRARVRARGRVKSAPVRALPVPCRSRRVLVTVI